MSSGEHGNSRSVYSITLISFHCNFAIVSFGVIHTMIIIIIPYTTISYFSKYYHLFNLGRSAENLKLLVAQQQLHVNLSDISSYTN